MSAPKWKINQVNYLMPNLFRLNDQWTDISIASGAITPTYSMITLVAESGTSDTLDSISSPLIGMMVVLRARAGDTITLSHNVGNLYFEGGANVTLSGDRMVMLMYDDEGSGRWRDFYNTSLATNVIGDIGAKVYMSANQSISDSTVTTLGFNSESWDTDTMHDNSTNNDRITFNSTGKYLVIAQVEFASNTTGYRSAQIEQVSSGGAVTSTKVIVADEAPSNTFQINISTIVSAVSTDYVRVKVYQNSGGSLNVTGGSDSDTWFSVQKLA